MKTALLGAVRRMLAAVLTVFGGAVTAFTALAMVLLMSGVLPIGLSPADQSSLCLPTSGTVSGLSLFTRINAALAALVSSNSGSSAPTNPCSGAPVAGQWWRDSSGGNAVQKLYDGTAWEAVGTMDASNGIWMPPVGGGAGSLASAATTDLWSVPQSYVVITGTTAITKLAGSSAPTGSIKTVSFAGALTLSHDATQLIVPGGRSLTTAVGDKAIVVALGGGNVAVLNYTPASGLAVAAVPTGHLDQFWLASCPGTWVEPTGGAIGDASSGASLRANADTFELFSAMWALDATVAAVQTSGGSASTRGGSAAIDFAAHKRIVVPDARGVFLRGLDDGRGVDTARLLASAQSDALKSHTHTASALSSFTGNALSGHTHTVEAGGLAHGFNPGSTGDTWFASADDQQNTGARPHAGTSSVSAGTPTGSVSTSVTVDATGAAETPVNVAALTCIKL